MPLHTKRYMAGESAAIFRRDFFVYFVRQEISLAEKKKIFHPRFTQVTINACPLGNLLPLVFKPLKSKGHAVTCETVPGR
jgi:hypothetical protein